MIEVTREIVEEAFRFLGWPLDRKLSPAEAQRLREIAWSIGRQRESNAKNWYRGSEVKP